MFNKVHYFTTAIIFLLTSFVAVSVNAGERAVTEDGREVVKVCYLNWGKQGGKDLPEQGFIPDLLSTVLREAGYEPKITIMPWTRCLKEVRSLKSDFVGSYWIGGEFDQWFDYLLPTTVDRINFISTKASGLTSGRMEDMYGKNIGILKGAGGLKEFRDQSEKFDVIEVANDHSMIKMLKKKRLDAILSNSPHILSLAETSFPSWRDDFVVLQPPVQSNIASPAIAVKNPRRKEIKERYNRAYKKLVAEGLYPRLMKKHQISVDYEMSEEDLKIFQAAQH